MLGWNLADICTVYQYTSILHIPEHVLGDKRLIDITGEDIKKAMAVAEAQSASVYRKASMLIKQLFADALTLSLIHI